MATRTRTNVLAQFATRTDEPITKGERKIINPVVFAAIGRTLGSAHTFAAFEATLSATEMRAYAPLFEGAPVRTRKVAVRKTARKGARRTARKTTRTSKTFDCGCTGLRQHMSAKNGCGIAAERKAAKANA